MSLGAKLLVGALVLGAAGTAGTYAVTNGGFGIGGNENTQTASNQNAPAAQESISASSDATARVSDSAPLGSQPESEPVPRASDKGVVQEADQHSRSANTNAQQQTLNGTGSSTVSGENGSQLQSEASVTPPGTVTDQSITGKESLPQPSGGGDAGTQPVPAVEDDSPKTPAQIENRNDADPEKSKEGTDGDSLLQTRPEEKQTKVTENSQSPSQPNPTGGGQNQKGKAEHDTGPNT